MLSTYSFKWVVVGYLVRQREFYRMGEIKRGQNLGRGMIDEATQLFLGFEARNESLCCDWV